MTDEELIARLRMVTGFIRFETGDRVAASICLSEEAADRIEQLGAGLEAVAILQVWLEDNLPDQIWETLPTDTWNDVTALTFCCRYRRHAQHPLTTETADPM